MLVADFNITFFLKQPEVLKLEQKTKLSSAEREKKFIESYRSEASGELKNQKFLSNLLAVDFNNRSEESKFK